MSSAEQRQLSMTRRSQLVAAQRYPTGQCRQYMYCTVLYAWLELQHSSVGDCRGKGGTGHRGGRSCWDFGRC